MRILHVVPFGVPGDLGSGAFSRFYSIAKPLQSEVEKYCVLGVPTLRSNAYTPRPKRDWDGFPVFEATTANDVSILRPYTTLRGLLGVAKKLHDVVLDFSPSILLVHNVSITVAFPSLLEKVRAGIPVVIDYTDIGGAGLSRTLVASIIEKIACTRADIVIATSSFLARRARRLGCRRVVYLPPMVDTTKFHPQEPDEHLQESLGLSDGAVFVFVGHSWYLKGVDLLLTALAILIPEFPDITLLLVGGNDTEQNQFAEIVKEMNMQSNVVLIGRVDHREIPRFIALADVAVIPFRDNAVNEAAGPIKAAEYLACGKPVVATAVGDLPKLIEHGTTGLITRPDADGIAEGIRNLISSPDRLEVMGKNARKVAVERHDMWQHSRGLLPGLADLLE